MGRRAVTAVLLDTHAWVWSLMASHRLTNAAKTVISTASAVHVSPISLFEVAQKVRAGKWPEMRPHLSVLAADEQARTAPFSRSVALLAGSMDWAHRDPFDRIIAATAVELACPVISKDAEFDGLDGLTGWKGRIWSNPVEPRSH